MKAPILALALSFVALARANTLEADLSKRQRSTGLTCSSYRWMWNAAGQSPCTVWDNLGSQCNPSFTVGLLPSNRSYPIPSGTNANDCQCNVVAFNLMSACSTCQEYTDMYENKWGSECRNYNKTGLNSSVRTSSLGIPGWAYLVSKDQFLEWDAPTASRYVVSFGQSTPIPGKTTASRAPTSTYRSGGGSTSGQSSGPQNNTLAVALGISGALVGLGAIIGLVLFKNRQSGRKAWYRSLAPHNQNGGYNGGYKGPVINTSSSSSSGGKGYGYTKSSLSSHVYAPGAPKASSQTASSQALTSHSRIQGSPAGSTVALSQLGRNAYDPPPAFSETQPVYGANYEEYTYRRDG